MHDIDDDDEQVVFFEENLLEIVVVVGLKINDHSDFIRIFMLADPNVSYILSIGLDCFFNGRLNSGIFEITDHSGKPFFNTKNNGRVKVVEFKLDHFSTV